MEIKYNELFQILTSLIDVKKAYDCNVLKLSFYSYNHRKQLLSKGDFNFKYEAQIMVQLQYTN
ncbi:unnamed protein product [Paramecium octaurelia]|uniref:Uncharacterized protein n=1 Tax=Paramecium octaurelia TaxID=43137 RepID=A0A8S1WHP5_PAROT|nr:unnamed protein product [Paramecium octaurelia]